MEGYQVISSKKILLCDIEDQHEQKAETSLQLDIEEMPSSPVSFEEIPSSPVVDEVIEVLSDDTNDNNDIEEISCEDNSSEVLGNRGYRYNGTNASDENPEMNIDPDTDNALENDNPSAIGFRRGRIPDNDSIEKYISYLCPQCGVDCGPVDKWKVHTESEHGFGLLEAANVESIVNKYGELSHKCRDCPKIFESTKSFSALIFHRISHLPFRDYFVCRICLCKYRSKATLKCHQIRNHHEQIVDVMPRSEDKALDHIRFFCPICKEQQINNYNWKAHMQEKHDYFNQARSKFEYYGSSIYICNVCKLKVRESHLVEHKQTHEDFKPFLCASCNISLSQLKAALRHVRYKHLRTPKELEWKCSLCKESFKSLCMRRKHYVVKHKVVGQTCKVCKRSFDSSSSLLTHMNSDNHYTLLTKT